MARPRKNVSPDLTTRVNLTAGSISRLTCPEDKQQVFLRDREAVSLRVRCTAAGAKSFVFEKKLHRQTIRRTIGDVNNWTIEQARAEARRLAVVLDNGEDPREIARQQQIQREQKRLLDQVQNVTIGNAWAEYIEERRPHWSEAHYKSHLEKASPGGQPSKRRGMKDQLTTPGPLAPFMSFALKDLNTAAIESWAVQEGRNRPSSARLAWRLLSVFLNWCTEHPQYATVVTERNPAKSRKVRESLGKAGVKHDVLTREQLPSWFSAVQKISNPVISSALQVMLLTGARPNEVLDLQWDDVNFKWNGLTIRDKVEGERVIPLTPYVSQLIRNLPHRNKWVFSSTRLLQMNSQNIKRRATKAARRGTTSHTGDVLETSESGRIAKPNTPHTRACKVAGIEGLTLQGLRRSFSSLTEWLEIPTGVVAQIQGHKPSATAEKHYKRRPLDLLRLHHERIESWILDQAEIKVALANAPDMLKPFKR